eukprot:TRINITY_DN1263_c0_g1_i4.p1 TRINITY_DN1263_c0_g1~~TRINITY_DN1263_c0_g1_i4.p1  ORF type:complete len:153 (-),score=30.53 TRINITY_DN1263_c0_g1_i4:122-580(-)
MEDFEDTKTKYLSRMKEIKHLLKPETKQDLYEPKEIDPDQWMKHLNSDTVNVYIDQTTGIKEAILIDPNMYKSENNVPVGPKKRIQLPKNSTSENNQYSLTERVCTSTHDELYDETLTQSMKETVKEVREAMDFNKKRKINNRNLPNKRRKM